MTCSDSNVVSVDHMLISILSVSVEALEMSCAAVAKALATQVCNLKADDLQNPCCLMCELRNQELVLYPSLKYVISFYCVSFPKCVLYKSNQILHTLTDSL